MYLSYVCIGVCMYACINMCVRASVCQNLTQQTTVPSVTMSYAGTLSYSWAADISISSENATRLHHELQNGDPTEHLDMRRCGHRFPIP